VVLSGCATVAVNQNFEAVQQQVQTRLGVQPRWLRTDGDRADAAAQANRLLAAPLQSDDAVRIAVTYSPAMQALLADAAAMSANATQSARLPNPVFTFERLIRREDGQVDKDIGRMLGFSLLDILLLPARREIADTQQAQLRLKSAADVVQIASDTRQTWVRAVAAQQSLVYFEQVNQAAEAGAELARRMRAVGNFSKLQHAREQLFYADATAQLARARQMQLATREALVRHLGLDAAQAAQLRLPDRLPDLPEKIKSADEVARVALESRLDVQMAKQELTVLATNLGANRITSMVDGLHLAGVRNSETGKPAQKGFEMELPIPLFDFGDARRGAAHATYLAAVNRTAQLAVDAASQVRETYGAYHTAHDLARHYTQEVVPLRKIVSDELLLKYNGMLTGVFELLADAREQISTVTQSIDAQRDFWIADAALQSTLLGKPAQTVALQGKAMTGSETKGH
jgi:outer membrane protein TolC